MTTKEYKTWTFLSFTLYFQVIPRKNLSNQGNMDLFTRFVYEKVEIEIQNLSNLVKKRRIYKIYDWYNILRRTFFTWLCRKVTLRSGRISWIRLGLMYPRCGLVWQSMVRYGAVGWFVVRMSDSVLLERWMMPLLDCRMFSLYVWRMLSN